jgi:hypothetical protein
MRRVQISVGQVVLSQMYVAWLPLCCCLLVACGAGGKTSGDRTVADRSEETPLGAAAQETAAEETAAEETAAEETPTLASPAREPSPVEPAATVPEACAPGSGADECAPPAAWVKQLCNGVYAEVALLMFRGGTPWRRLYLRGKTRAVNASGGATVDGHLSRDEEVLVLRQRKGSASEMQIGDGSGQYDVLRWNGSCVSLEAGEVTARRPRSAGQARIEWRWLGEGMRGALRKDEAVSQAFLARKKECRGATTGTVSKACERLDLKLIERIAAHVRSGPELPPPEEHP